MFIIWLPGVDPWGFDSLWRMEKSLGIPDWTSGFREHDLGPTISGAEEFATKLSAETINTLLGALDNAASSIEGFSKGNLKGTTAPFVETTTQNDIEILEGDELEVSEVLADDNTADFVESIEYIMTTHESDIETRIVFHKTNAGNCKLHCTVKTDTESLFENIDGTDKDTRLLPSIYLVDGRTNCDYLLSEEGEIKVKFIGAIRFAGVVEADVSDVIRFDELYGRCVAILIQKDSQIIGSSMGSLSTGILGVNEFQGSVTSSPSAEAPSQTTLDNDVIFITVTPPSFIFNPPVITTQFSGGDSSELLSNEFQNFEPQNLHPTTQFSGVNIDSSSVNVFQTFVPQNPQPTTQFPGGGNGGLTVDGFQAFVPQNLNPTTQFSGVNNDGSSVNGFQTFVPQNPQPTTQFSGEGNGGSSVNGFQTFVPQNPQPTTQFSGEGNGGSSVNEFQTFVPHNPRPTTQSSGVNNDGSSDDGFQTFIPQNPRPTTQFSGINNDGSSNNGFQTFIPQNLGPTTPFSGGHNGGLSIDGFQTFCNTKSPDPQLSFLEEVTVVHLQHFRGKGRIPSESKRASRHQGDDSVVKRSRGKGRTPTNSQFGRSSRVLRQAGMGLFDDEGYYRFPLPKVIGLFGPKSSLTISYIIAGPGAIASLPAVASVPIVSVPVVNFVPSFPISPGVVNNGGSSNSIWNKFSTFSPTNLRFTSNLAQNVRRNLRGEVHRKGVEETASWIVNSVFDYIPPEVSNASPNYYSTTHSPPLSSTRKSNRGHRRRNKRPQKGSKAPNRYRNTEHNWNQLNSYFAKQRYNNAGSVVEQKSNNNNHDVSNSQVKESEYIRYTRPTTQRPRLTSPTVSQRNISRRKKLSNRRKSSAGSKRRPFSSYSNRSGRWPRRTTRVPPILSEPLNYSDIYNNFYTYQRRR
ncbi:unnamed protein product [Lepeophtheirus salmonis]|uniref:(salmon louse) hypothetical protein n=1 Tax=Lepeophtheirus salmonis TaxID=72036 RepID=A0A7R8CX81_LEPSM|nr:unnamed protein product [Lepeophtheirus salmonis]CAF2928931.1 unnamed protein product [Lepeophtheirus salmonis]